jgi:hypothetical protein
MTSFGGMRIFYVDSALKETDVRLFPASRKRSKRTLKKLLKRFGGAFQKKPCIFKNGNALYCHPALKAELEAAIKIHYDGKGSSGLWLTMERV